MNRIIARLNKKANETEDFIQECEDSGKFDKYQIQIIRDGFDKGLTLEEIKTYAKPNIDWEEMQDIKYDLLANNDIYDEDNYDYAADYFGEMQHAFDDVF